MVGSDWFALVEAKKLRIGVLPRGDFLLQRVDGQGDNLCPVVNLLEHRFLGLLLILPVEFSGLEFGELLVDIGKLLLELEVFVFDAA